MGQQGGCTRYRVLLVDHHADVADLVLAILSNAGYSVGVLGRGVLDRTLVEHD